MTNHDPIRNLEPKSLWNAFVDLNAVPRPSKNEAAVSAFVASRGRALNLETTVDGLGNVLIRKPASPGYESHATIVLQSHIDMVWQKNADTDFDFHTQGIQMYVDGDWVKAHGTTLGADNGIGVATIFSVLESTTMPHPPLECIFTIDEETGMTGAKELDPTWLQGRVLLNLDTEQDNELTIGCAGGANVTATASYSAETVGQDVESFTLRVRGLTGGHSGVDIHLGRANANKVMNRILYLGASQFGLRLSSLEGGSLRNAIPRESVAMVVVPKATSANFRKWLAEESATIQKENAETDPKLQVTCESVATSVQHVLPNKIQSALFSAISGTLSGIHRMSPSIAGLVQTSNNLARVHVVDGSISVLCLARSSVDSERDALTAELTSVLEQLGGPVVTSDQYPGWRPVPTSKIVTLMSRLYEEMFGEPAHVAACHAGLECGIIGDKFPGMEMISFGPNIYGAHSPDERVQISSVQKFYKYFAETLARL
jgi:dipeptidase D